MRPVKGPVADRPCTLGILSKAKFPARGVPQAKRTPQSGETTAMTMSETPRDPIPMTGPAPMGELLVSVTETEANLRLFVKSGGCSGFSYGLAFDDKLNEGDRLEDHAGVPIVIDSFSAQYVDGAEIDYVDSLMGSGFAINNPNAVSSCACGSSFNTDGSPAKAGGCAH